MPQWDELRRSLAALPSPEPTGRRVGAALALLTDVGDDLELLLTRRRDDLSTHPGQVSFPGGRVDPGETVPAAALREAAEEVALDPGTVELLGSLPAGYIPPSRYWLQVVVGRWVSPHALAPAQDEVAEILSVRLSTLRDPSRWRVVRLSSAAVSWAWQVDDRHLLWGATAMATAALLDMVDPNWHGGAAPADLPGDREVRPWDTPERRAPRAGAPRLPGLPEWPLDAVDPGGRGPSATLDGVDAAGRAVAEAAVRLAAGASGGPGIRAVLLVGGGGNGAAGVAAAARLAEAGVHPQVVVATAADRLRPNVAALLDGLAARPVHFDGALPDGDVVVDALVGAGLDGPLRAPALDVVLALRRHGAPVVSVDLPSGLHAEEGLVGDCVAADVTVALGAARPGLLRAGLGPFVGDLYLAPLSPAGAPPLVRLVPGSDHTRWRE